MAVSRLLPVVQPITLRNAGTERQISLRVVERVPSVEEYRALRESVGWRNHSKEAQYRGLQNSLFSICLECDGSVIGCGRVIGDVGIYFYVQDIMVSPAFQRQGFGKVIMDAVMEYIFTHAEQGAFVGLMAAKGREGFYERYGFKACGEDWPAMGFKVGDM